MTNRNWLQKAWNRIRGLTEQDFENCRKLGVLTGLDWQPYSAATEHESTTVYAARLEHEDVASTITIKLNSLLATQMENETPMTACERSFAPADNRTIITAGKLLKLEVKKGANLVDVKTAITATLHEAREELLRKNQRALLNNIPA